MKLDRLIEYLEMVRDDLEAAGQDASETEVRIMSQPSWPFENAISGVTHTTRIAQYDDDDLEPESGPEIVYILEGSQIKYGNRDAWDAAII